jgi:hypothetical protein
MWSPRGFCRALKSLLPYLKASVSFCCIQHKSS